MNKEQRNQKRISLSGVAWKTCKNHCISLINTESCCHFTVKRSHNIQILTTHKKKVKPIRLHTNIHLKFGYRTHVRSFMHVIFHTVCCKPAIFYIYADMCANVWLRFAESYSSWTRNIGFGQWLRKGIKCELSECW